MNLAQQIDALESKARLVDEIRKIVGGGEDQRARLEVRVASLEEEVENITKARDEDVKQARDLRDELSHTIGAAGADLRSVAQRLGERFDGDPETLTITDIASKVDEAVAGLLEDYECAKADAKPARTKKPKHADPPSLVGESAPPASDTPAESSTTVSSSAPAAKVSEAVATGDDPFVIMRTIPSGRQLYSERDGRFVPLNEVDLAAKYADSIDAEAVKRSRNLRKTKVMRLSAALTPKVNAPRVEVIAQAGDEGAFVVCTHDKSGKRAWLTTDQGLMPEHDGQRVRTFAETQTACDEQGNPIAEFELLEEARSAADDLAKSMPNAGGVCVVEVHDVGALVIAEERKAAAE